MGAATITRGITPTITGDGELDGHGICLNCGTALIGTHCHACGQAGHVHRTLWSIVHDVAHGIFHFEGRIWRTLPLLAWRPGELTRRYIDGERVRFVSPLALFLFSIFIFFASLGWVGAEPSGISRTMAQARSNTGAAEQRAAIAAKQARIEAARAEAIRRHQPTAELDRQARGLRIAMGALGRADAAHGSGGDDGKFVSDATMGQVDTGWPRLDAGIRHANDNPDLALYKLQSSAYKYSWLLIPLSTPFVAALFLWRRRFGLYDHATFVTYSLCFMLWLTTALLVAHALGISGVFVALAAILVPPVHLFRQLRGAYSLGRFGAGWRTAALLGFAFTALMLFGALLIAHGLTE